MEIEPITYRLTAICFSIKLYIILNLIQHTGSPTATMLRLNQSNRIPTSISYQSLYKRFYKIS